MPDETVPSRPLSSLEVGEVGYVVSVGIGTEWQGRLNAMGISVGKHVALIARA